MIKVVEIYIDINSAMSTCLRNGVKVYPVIKGRKFSIEVDYNGRKICGIKEFGHNNIANGVSKTYKYYARKILQQQDGK